MADTIVVGAGAAGCALAALLAGRGRSVLLVEAGTDENATADRLSTLGPWPSGAVWDWPAEVRGGGAIAVPRVRAVGGNSLVQGGIALHGFPSDYDRWPASWSHERLLPYLRRIEQGPIAVRTPEPAEHLPLHHAFLDSCTELGFARCDDFNAGEAQGAGPLPLARRGLVKQTARRCYLEPARELPSLTVLADHEVTRLVLAGTRVTGVEVRGRDGVRRLHADQVVLTAGAPGSAILLLRSGVGAPDELSVAGVAVRHALPGVGKGLHDHPSTRFTFTVPLGRGRPDPLWFQVALRLAGGAGLPSLAVEAFHDFRLLPSEHAYSRAVLVCSLLDAEATGTVGIDPVGTARIRLGFHDEGDLARLAAVARLGARLLSTGGLSRLHDEPHAAVRHRDISPDELVGKVVSAHHLHGGCAMGTDPDAGAVVDENCRVHGLSGLHVADVSVVPAQFRANTHLLALCLAERVSELVGT
jgi:choline dehydrogenase-like flavoprotein